MEFTLKITFDTGDTGGELPQTDREEIIADLITWAERNGYAVTICDDHSEEAIGELLDAIREVTKRVTASLYHDVPPRMRKRLADILVKYDGEEE